jgi:hypothetical protein
MPEETDLRKWVREETKKCMADPIFFMRKYVKIQNPNEGGTVPFDLYPFQEKTLNCFHDDRFLLILKSRQLGITTLVSAYSLWQMLFNSDRNILVISIKQEISKEIITKVRFANEHLPSWLRIQATEDNRLSLRLKNGSMIAATSSAKDAGRSKALSLLVLDEAAFIDEAKSIWTSAFNTLSTGGRAIVLSTPNGVGNWFHEMWVKAERKQNDFITLRLPWQLHPKRGQSWRDEQEKQLGQRGASQECDCDFLTSGTNVIDLKILEEYSSNNIHIEGDPRPSMGVRDPIEFRYSNFLWIWELPKEQKSYVVSADPARGDGSDYSAAHVLNIETLEQVAEFKQQIPPKEFADILVNLSTEYNDALLIVEYNGLGPAILQRIVDRQYKNTFYSSLDLKVVEVQRQIVNRYYAEEKKLKPGFTTTISTRPLLISKLEAYFRERIVDIHSSRTIEELRTFIWDAGKAQAAENYNDDLTMALCLGMWVRDTAIRLRQEGVILSRNILDNIDVKRSNEANTPIYTAKTANTGQSTWQMRVGGRPGDVESLTWLLR